MLLRPASPPAAEHGDTAERRGVTNWGHRSHGGRRARLLCHASVAAHHNRIGNRPNSPARRRHRSDGLTGGGRVGCGRHARRDRGAVATQRAAGTMQDGWLRECREAVGRHENHGARGRVVPARVGHGQGDPVQAATGIGVGAGRQVVRGHRSGAVTEVATATSSDSRRPCSRSGRRTRRTRGPAAR